MSDAHAFSEVGDTLVKADSDTVLRADSTGPGASGRTTTDPGLKQTTVLPRVEWKGDRPEVVPSSRARFEMLGELGRGGMGEVVLAHDNDIQRTVALKLLAPESDLGLVLRFIDEIRTIGRLEHPNIMPVHDVGIDTEGRYYFVMKHIQGETLETIIQRLRSGDEAAHLRYPFTARVQLFVGVCHAVAYAHQQGFLHRDLKPSNIMVGPNGEVTLMDWGLARQFRAPRAPAELDAAKACLVQMLTSKRATIESRAPSVGDLNPVRDPALALTQAGSVMGTPLYMSPEQARGEHDKLDEKSDIYALTVILHELLHLEHYLGHCKTKDEVLEGVQRTSPRLHGAGPLACQRGVPAELDWFIDRGMQKDPAQRFANVEEMIGGLRAIASGRIRVQCPRTAMKRAIYEAEAFVDRHPNIAMLLGLGLGATVVFGAVQGVLRLVG